MWLCVDKNWNYYLKIYEFENPNKRGILQYRKNAGNIREMRLISYEISKNQLSQ